MESRLAHGVYDRSPVWLQNWLVSLEGRRNRRLRFGPCFEDHLRFLDESQWWSETQFEAYQDEQTSLLVRHAYEYIPYYRRTFDRLNLKPSDIKGRDDLRKLPILEKETVISHSNDLVSTAFNRRALVRGHTSGTTGGGLPIWISPEGWQKEFAFAWRLYGRGGVSRSDSHATFNARLVVPAGRTRPPFWRHNYAGKQTVFSVYHVSEDTVGAYVRELSENPRGYWQGYPSFIYLVASHLSREKAQLPIPPKAVFTSSETLLSYQRETIESATGSPVWDRYGNAELCASIVQCERGRYHVDMEYGVLELEPLHDGGPGRRGQLICTGFVNHAMPLIRYRIGDVAVFGDSPCACGRQSTVVDSIDGRVEDYVITPEGRSVGRLDHIFKDLTDIEESQILQRTPDAITVRVVRRPRYNSRSEKELLREIRQRLGRSIGIEIEYVSDIPRGNNGKFRAVISELVQSVVSNRSRPGGNG